MQSSRLFKCDFDLVKKSFCESLNAIIDETGQFAKTDVVEHLLKAECSPVLSNALNASPILNATHLR